MKPLLLIPILVSLVGCAGSAGHPVQDPYKVAGGSVACDRLALDLSRSQGIIDTVQADRADINGADVVDTILWFPFSLIAKDINYNSATEAAQANITAIRELQARNSCR